MADKEKNTGQFCDDCGFLYAIHNPDGSCPLADDETVKTNQEDKPSVTITAKIVITAPKRQDIDHIIEQIEHCHNVADDKVEIIEE